MDYCCLGEAGYTLNNKVNRVMEINYEYVKQIILFLCDWLYPKGNAASSCTCHKEMIRLITQRMIVIMSLSL